jgi:nitroimidazol reductase NimA-like FMN-containing flavoprotein (pyridoxamine 5'-phosphate oxidase superfamily)
VRELSTYEIEAFLGEETVARIGCSGDGEIYVVPVIYAYDGGAAYVLTMEGRKTRVMREHPDVCFEVDSYDGETGSWRSVIGWGTYEELDGEAAQEARRIVARSFEARTGRKRIGTDGAEVPFVAFRIVLETLTGREIVRPPA